VDLDPSVALKKHGLTVDLISEVNTIPGHVAAIEKHRA
jgi:hypothetical protein